MSSQTLAQAQQEHEQFNTEVRAMEQWWTNPRFKYTKRPYSAADAVGLRSSLTGPQAQVLASNYTAKKLYSLCRSRYPQGRYVQTFGALDTVQVTQMAEAGVECVYVSGWQCSSTASSSNEPGPDFADYPANTVPNKVDQLFRAQLFHDRKQRAERSKMSVQEKTSNPRFDYLRPIIADGDTGFGGMTSVMKMMKMQIESGAAGVHIEDQLPGAKKCGHMGGKVLVHLQEQVDRLVACRLQADICGTETVIISRTDASSATYLDNNSDPRDHPYIGGASVPVPRLNDLMREAQTRGDPPSVLAKLQEDWKTKANVVRYPEAVAAAIRKNGGSRTNSLLQQWEAAKTMSHRDARALAKKLGFEGVYWDWEAPRSREGYYRVVGGTDYCAMRAIAFSAVADLIWMETATPNIQEAKEFSDLVHAVVPHQMLAYNLSPSFNWDAAGMSDDDITQFQVNLGRLGFTWHFITLAGFHTNALAVTKWAREYQARGVVAYVQTVQREERRLDVSTLTHQRWSGAQFCDKMMAVATGGGASTSSMGHGVTEAQFKAKL